MNKTSAIRSKIFELLDQREPSETICPSEVARALFPVDWREEMESVRKVAITLTEEKQIDITQQGKKVSPPFKGPIRLRKIIDYRERPELYRVLKGEQGVLTFEPYKSELLPLWKFRTPADAEVSSQNLLKKFKHYLKEMDFAGMDMARKFIQMGYTRSRRYANHRSGQKYDGPVPKSKKGVSGAHGRAVLPLDQDPIKAESARIFKEVWDKVEANPEYSNLKRDWKLWYG